jgi:hypothetical protein
MRKAKEYKELYVSADEYYIMDDDIDNDNLEKPFINNTTNDNNNDENDQINEFNKITQISFPVINKNPALIENKTKTHEIGINTDININKIMCDKSTTTEQFTNNILVDSTNSINSINYISPEKGCGKIFKCVCVVS